MGPSAEPLLLPHAAVVLRRGAAHTLLWCSATARLAATCSQHLLPSRSARNGRSSGTFQ
jgi:hypothetical protein